MKCVLFAAFLGAIFQTAAAPISFQSQQNRTALLELYTSEGCSSCPSAEAWLSKLKDAPGLWRDFVPIAFHVDYWDSLGWKDPFAMKAYSEHQRDYAASWRSRSVYTPGFVLDAKEWRGWFNSHQLPRSSPTAIGVLTARSEDGIRWTLYFQPAGNNGPPSYDLHAALLGFDLSSEVKAGENRGRKLYHDFVVLAIAKGALSKSGDSYHGALSLEAPARISPKRLAIAAWITPPGSMQFVQAVGGWLSSTNGAQ